MNITDTSLVFNRAFHKEAKPEMLKKGVSNSAILWVDEDIQLGSALLEWADPPVAPTNPSPELETHPLCSNIVPSRLMFNYRPWNATAAPARAVQTGIPMLTPVGKLMGTTLLTDAVVGYDMHFLSQQLERGFQRMWPGGVFESSTSALIAYKVLRAHHELIFTNFSRFPVQVFIEYLRAGENAVSLPFMALAGADAATPGTLGPYNQTQNTPAVAELPEYRDNVESFLVPGAIENDDAGVTSSKKITVDPFKIFGPEWGVKFMARSMAEDIAGTVNPWNILNQEVLARSDANVPTNLEAPKDFDGGNYILAQDGCYIALSARLVAPVGGIGTHGDVRDIRAASTEDIIEVEGLPAMGDQSNLSVSMKSKWLCLLHSDQQTIEAHRGTKAYPNQSA